MFDICTYLQSTLSLIQKENPCDGQTFISILRLTSLLRIQTYLNSLSHLSCHNNSLALKIHLPLSTNYRETISDIYTTIDNLKDFLISQLSCVCTVNYEHIEIASTYPDDIDDTFSTLYLLESITSDWTTNTKLATIIYTLNQIRNTDTPYLFNTWYSKAKPWHSTDIVAQSAIVAYFDTLSIPCEELRTYIIESMLKFSDSTSEFYPNAYIALYLVSRMNIPRSDFKEIYQYIREAGQDYSGAHILIASAYWQDYMQDKYKDRYHSVQTTTLNSPAAPNDNSPTKLYIEHKNPLTYATDHIFDRLIFIEYTLGKILYCKSNQLWLLSGSAINQNIQTLEAVQNTILTFLKQYIITSRYSDEIKQNISIELDKIIASKDFKILYAMYLDIYRIDQGCESTSTKISDNFLKDASTLLYAYYLYDKIADNSKTHYLLPLFVQIYREGIKVLHVLYQTKNIDWIQAETSLMTCDRFYMSVFTSGYTPKEYKELVKITKQVPFEAHADKSCGLQIFLPLLCNHLTLKAELYDLQSWYSAILSYPRYIQTIFQHLIKTLQLARQLADDLDDFAEDISQGKCTTAHYFTNSDHQILDKRKMLDAIMYQINISEIYISILASTLKTAQNYSHIQHTLNYLSNLSHEIKNHLIRSRRDKMVLRELCRLSQIFPNSLHISLIT
jgi:hypothetical protein